ncbi:unnamed protein product, partial [Adineta steineri]
MSTVTLTIEKPQNTTTKDVVLLKNGEELKPSDHVKIKSISPTTTEVNITKVKREDEGDYTVEVKGVEQPLVRLIVHPKPVVRQEMQLPKTQFNEKETLTIVCQFDATPEEPFIFLHNDKPIVADSRVTTTIEDNKYTIVVKDLRPEEDEGVYTLKSDHLILDTPSISIVPEEKKPQNETVTIEEEEETITITPEQQKPETSVQETETVETVVEVEQPKTIQQEMPEHEVEENTTVTLTIEKPQQTATNDVHLFKDGQEVKPSEHIQLTSTSPTTTEVQIIKAKPEDEGEYTVVIDNKEQPLMKLKVHPKPIVRQEMQLPKTRFNEKETLTIVCQFDATPEEPFVFLHNDQPIVADSRITTTVENNKYTIVVKDLRPEEDEGVYMLKSDHLILDTPSISIVPEDKKPQTETEIVEEEETVTVTVNQPETEEVIEEVIEEIKQEPKKKPEMPIQEVEEMSTVTLTIEKPQNTTTKDVVLLKNGEELKPSDHVKIKSISPTTTEVNITKVKREDEGDYTVEVKGVEQPLVRLIVHPKPVIRQEMQLPKTQFNEKETLTIVCQFDATPEEPFIFL